MSRRSRWVRRVLLAGAVASLLSHASPALGQDRELLGTRIEALRVRLEKARVAADRADARRADSLESANQVRLDTLMVGPLRVAHLPSQRKLALEVMGEAWKKAEPLVKGSDGIFADQVFLFRYGWRFEGNYLKAENLRSVEMNRRYGRERLAEKAQREVARSLLEALPEDGGALMGWLGNSVMVSEEDLEWVYRDLASSPSVAAKRCYRGDLEWCWKAAGLPLGEGGWDEWYSPEERRLKVKSRWGHWLEDERLWSRMSHSFFLTHGCVALESDRACSLMLQRVPAAIPLEATARSSLVAEALTQGGEGAFTRFLSASGRPIRDRLAEAAGMPADTLVALWRARVLEARPESHAGLILSPLPLALWLVLLLGLATKSSRWRLG